MKYHNVQFMPLLGNAAWNMISMEIYYCHVLQLRVSHNRRVISLICLTNEIFWVCIFVCMFVRAVYLRSNFILIKHTALPSPISTPEHNHMLTSSFLVKIARKIFIPFWLIHHVKITRPFVSVCFRFDFNRILFYFIYAVLCSLFSFN